MAMSFTTLISVFVICICYIDLTQGAGNEDNRNFSTTSRLDKRSMKRLMNLEIRENVTSSPSREIRKKGRSDEGSSSARDRLTGKIKVESEPEPERGGVSRNHSKGWTNEEQRGLIRLAYMISPWRKPNITHSFNWKLLEEHWNREWDDRSSGTLRKKLSRMREKMREAAQEFDANHKWSPLPDDFVHNLLKIYFETEVGDKARHGERIFAEWRRMGFPITKGMTPAYMFDRAQAMLESVKKFDISNPRGRTAMLRNLEQVEWTPEQDEYFRKLLLKHSYNESNRIKNIFNEALNRYPGLDCVGQKLLSEHFRHTYPELLSPLMTSGPIGGSSHDTTNSQYHPSEDDYNLTSLSLGTHPHYRGMASTSSHPVPSHDNLDLELHLDSLYVGEHSPDTELKLGYPSHRGAHQ